MIPKSVEDFKNQGNNFLRENKYNEAINSFSEGLILDPKNHLLLSNRSVTYLILNKVEDALEDACKVVEFKPDWFKGYLRKSNALVRLMLFQESKKVLEEGIRITNDETLKKKLVEVENLIETEKVNKKPEIVVDEEKKVDESDIFSENDEKNNDKEEPVVPMPMPMPMPPIPQKKEKEPEDDRFDRVKRKDDSENDENSDFFSDVLSDLGALKKQNYDQIQRLEQLEDKIMQMKKKKDGEESVLKKRKRDPETDDDEKKKEKKKQKFKFSFE